MRTKLWLALLVSFCSGFWLSAGEVPPVPYDQTVDVVYAEVYGTGLLMDVFTPKAKTNGLGIIDVVSGAYKSDRGKIRDHVMAQVYGILCGRGYTVFAVRPGSRPRYTASEMAANVRTGIRFVQAHAQQYKIDPERLGLTGASAGGHLGLLAAVAPDEGKPTNLRAVAVFFPPTDFLDWDGKMADLEYLGPLLFPDGGQGHSEEEIKERARQISPARLVKQPASPFLLFHGDADPVVPLQQSRRMVEAIKAAGGSAELIVKPGGGHPWFTIFEEVKVMADWFDQKLSRGQAGRTNAPAS